jgi:glycyl-tRNA synthetase
VKKSTLEHSLKVSLETIVALCKRRGFIYPSSEIYGGLNGVYDFGPLGALMKEHVRRFWKLTLIHTHREIIFFEGSLLAPPAVWHASGHLENFNDPMVDCLACKKRFRADELDLKKACPSCGILQWTQVRQFNLMFKTDVGATQDGASVAYLRPETAQSIFVNFKNVMSSYRTKIPFGIAQIGRSFRNEITPKQFLFRTREFEQMELEWFCRPEHSADDFVYWLNQRKEFYKKIGLSSERTRFRAHEQDELAHYSKACTDVEFYFPFGWKELEGIAHRGAYDLSQHTTHSKKDLSVYDDETKESYVPHVVESSVGSDRLMLALLCDAYCEEVVDEDTRVVLKLHPAVAPITAAFLPLTKKLSDPLRAVYQRLRDKGYSVQFDETGSIGKRYRRQDEIGTPLCFTYDFDSEQDHSVTVRHRDTMEQSRVAIDDIEHIVCDAITL